MNSIMRVGKEKKKNELRGPSFKDDSFHIVSNKIHQDAIYMATARMTVLLLLLLLLSASKSNYLCDTEM